MTRKPQKSAAPSRKLPTKTAAAKPAAPVKAAPAAKKAAAPEKKHVAVPPVKAPPARIAPPTPAMAISRSGASHDPSSRVAAPTGSRRPRAAA